MLQPDPTSAGPTLGLRPTIGSLPSPRFARSACRHGPCGPDPAVVRRAGHADAQVHLRCRRPALAAGDTFYQPNAGIHELRAALAEYMNGLYGARLTPENVIVSASAMNALMLVMQALVDPGDVVVTTTPSWPNLPALPQILSGRVRSIPLDSGNAGWRLDLPGCSTPAMRARA